MKRTLLLLPCLLVWAISAAAQADSLDVARAADRVRILEATRRQAMVAADTKVLAGIFADDATYAHSNGLTQTRDELLRTLERGEIRYASFTVEDVRYRAYDGVIVGTGIQRIEVRADGRSLKLRSRYTVVYAGAGEAWKLIAYQSTPMPEMTPGR
jgi:uncharacterized protein (TIGR02246 family)